MKLLLTPLRALAVAVMLAGSIVPAFTADEVSPVDTAWKELRKAATPPSPPREWSTERPSDEALAKFNQSRATKALAAADKAKAFYGEYPADKRAAEARLMEYNLLTAVVQLGDSSVTDRMITLQAALADDPSIDEEERLGMVLMAAKSALQGATSDDPVPGMLKAKGVFLKAFTLFPKRAEPAAYLLQLAEMLLAYDQPEAAQDIFRQLDKEGTDEEVRTAIKAQREKFDRLGKPVEIAFTAIDGRKVDVAALKGKVVMIDFWATWCGPCIGEMPNVKAAYQAHHERGFEVIGVSLDQDKATLQKGITAMGLPWPQLFDGGAWETLLAKKCAVRSIPSTFLIGKDGVLLATNLRGEALAAGVTAALAMGR